MTTATFKIPDSYYCGDLIEKFIGDNKSSFNTAFKKTNSSGRVDLHLFFYAKEYYNEEIKENCFYEVIYKNVFFGEGISDDKFTENVHMKAYNGVDIEKYLKDQEKESAVFLVNPDQITEEDVALVKKPCPLVAFLKLCAKQNFVEKVKYLGDIPGYRVCDSDKCFDIDIGGETGIDDVVMIAAFGKDSFLFSTDDGEDGVIRKENVIGIYQSNLSE